MADVDADAVVGVSLWLRGVEDGRQDFLCNPALATVFNEIENVCKMRGEPHAVAQEHSLAAMGADIRVLRRSAR